jgi:hypothetical protein
MSAAAVTGTPDAANPTAAAAPPAAAEAPTLADMLGGLSAEPEAGSSPDAAEPAEPGKEPAAKLDDEVLFSDESLATPEGLAKAKSRIADLRRQTHEKYLETKKFNERAKQRAEKLNARVDAWKQEKQNHDLVIGTLRNDIQALQSGDPELMIGALGRMTNTDGIVALERLNQRLINRSKDPDLDPRVAQLLQQQEAKLQAVQAQLEAKELQARRAQLDEGFKKHAVGIGHDITSGSAQMPNLARLYADDPQGVTKYIMDDIIDSAQRGQPVVDKRAYFGQLEAQLTRALSPGAVAPKGDGGAAAATQSPAGTAQRSPGQSVGPSAAGSALSTRTPSDEEAQRQLAHDDGFWKQLGGFGMA